MLEIRRREIPRASHCSPRVKSSKIRRTPTQSSPNTCRHLVILAMRCERTMGHVHKIKAFADKWTSTTHFAKPQTTRTTVQHGGSLRGYSVCRRGPSWENVASFEATLGVVCTMVQLRRGIDVANRGVEFNVPGGGLFESAHCASTF